MGKGARLLIGRLIITLVAVGTIISPYLADWNATHIYNTLWPPHAKFHNAQTMTLGTLLGLAALTFTWRRDILRLSNLAAALLFTSLYWISQPLAFLFPGVAWTDPNLLKPSQSLADFPIQLKGDLVIVPLVALAGWLIASAERAHTEQ